jgi:hypothetical protein
MTSIVYIVNFMDCESNTVPYEKFVYVVIVLEQWNGIFHVLEFFTFCFIYNLWCLFGMFDMFLQKLSCHLSHEITKYSSR